MSVVNDLVLSAMVSGQATRIGLLDELVETRSRTLALVAGLSEFELSQVVTPLLSPLLWDLGHIANFEQRWLLGGGGDQLDDVYDPFETPRAKRGELPFLHSDECLAYMETVREKVAERIDDADPYLAELVIHHEQQHNETMLQLLRMLDGYVPPAALRRSTASGAGAFEGHWVAIPSGTYTVGSAPDGAREFVYDNEMTEHQVRLDAFEIASLPVRNGEFAEWVEAGAYERPEWWSAGGREWLNVDDARSPLGWIRDGGQWLATGFGERRPLDSDAPVCHVSWWEAEAYAAAHGARLPSEFEWEVAAATDPVTCERSRQAWGDDAWREELANLDQRAFGTRAAGAFAVASPSGCVDMAGQVWEWTSTEFAAYPGFEPFCYEQYSAPFFGRGYRVLRGGSWATRPRTVDARFRNWDRPERRQIFSGFRLARDA